MLDPILWALAGGGYALMKAASWPWRLVGAATGGLACSILVFLLKLSELSPLPVRIAFSTYLIVFGGGALQGLLCGLVFYGIGVARAKAKQKKAPS